MAIAKPKTHYLDGSAIQARVAEELYQSIVSTLGTDVEVIACERGHDLNRLRDTVVLKVRDKHNAIHFVKTYVT